VPLLDWSAGPYFAGELVGSAISAVAARLVWSHRQRPGAMALAITLIACVWWSFWHAWSLVAATLPLKLALADLWEVGAAAVDSTILIFALEYRRQAPLSWRVRGLFLLPFGAILALFWTNSWLHLYWPTTAVVPGPPFSRLALTFGPGAWLLTGWAAVSQLTTIITLIRVSLEHRGLYRRQVAFMLAGIALPSVLYLLFASGHALIPNYDVTTLSLSGGISLIAWALYSQRMLDIMPIAHHVVMDGISDGVVVVDEQDRVLYANPAARLLVDGAEPVGRAIGQTWPELARVLSEASQRAVLSAEIGERQRFFDVLVSPVSAGRGRALILRDETDRRLVGELEHAREQMILDLRLANAELSRLDQMKSELISNVSHELRAPLASIRAFAELLRDSSLDEATRADFTRIVHEESERLTRLVTSVLDMSRLESGAVLWKPSVMDVAHELRSAYLAFQPVAEEKGVALRLDLPPELPAVEFDPDGLRQVMTNLLSNAIKFTERGEVAIIAREDASGIRVSVRDTGPGIPAEDQARVFERFYQLGHTLESKPPGSGLGLAIVKEILRQQGVDIRLESAPGEGCCFSFRLPVAAPSAAGA